MSWNISVTDTAGRDLLEEFGFSSDLIGLGGPFLSIPLDRVHRIVVNR